MNFQNNEWRIIRRPKSGGLVSHIGIQMPDGRVIHNAPGLGEHISSLPEFGGGQPVYDCGPIPKTYLLQLKKNLLDAVMNPRQYDVVSNNCEHFVTRMIGNTARSPQLNFFALFGSLFLLLSALSA